MLPWTKLHSVFSVFTEGVRIYVTKPANFLRLKNIWLWPVKHVNTNQYQNNNTLNSALHVVIKGLFRKLPNFTTLTFTCGFFAEKLWKLIINTFSCTLHVRVKLVTYIRSFHKSILTLSCSLIQTRKQVYKHIFPFRMHSSYVFRPLLFVIKELQSWTKAVETLPEKDCFVKRASFSIPNFDISNPSPFVNVVAR